MRQLLVAGLALAAAFVFWRSSQVAAPSASITTAPASDSAQSPDPGAPAAAVGAAATTAAATSERAKAPDVPTNSAPESQVVFGVVYDLATLRPVAGADVRVGEARATTDERGWYRVELKRGALEGGVPVTASAPGYRGAIQERSPALASLSDGRRRGVSEESPRVPGPFHLVMRSEVRLGELRLAMMPDRWPGSAAPEFADVAEPPPPPALANGSCRYYGVVYDLATKKPLRGLDLITTGIFGTIETDPRGRYVAELQTGKNGVATLSARATGYQPGLLADLDPPLATVGPDERRRYAEEQEAPGPVKLEDACEDGIVHQDLVAVPASWPANPSVAASAVDPAQTRGDDLSAFVAQAPVENADGPRGVPLVDPLVTDAPADPAQAARVKNAALALKDEQRSLFQAEWARHHSLVSPPPWPSTPLGTGENPQPAASATQGSTGWSTTPRRGSPQTTIVPANGGSFRR